MVQRLVTVFFGRYCKKMPIFIPLTHPIRTFICFTLTMSVCSCSTAGKSILLGGTVGVLTGAAIGNNHPQQPGSNSALIGAGVGGTIGALIGYVSFKSRNIEKVNSDDKSSDEPGPKLTKPGVKRVWVPDEIRGNEFIRGHWKFIIDTAPVWSKE